MKLAGTKTDGSAFAVNVNARTSRVRLYKETDIATLDLAGLEKAAPAIAIFEMGFDDAARIANVAELAGLPALSDLSLSADATTDLTPLARSRSIVNLHLSVHGDASSFDAAFLATLAENAPLRSLSLTFRGAAPVVDERALRPKESLSLDGVGNASLRARAGLTSFNATKCNALTSLHVDAPLRYLHVMQCARLATLDLVGMANGPAENVHIADVPALSTIDLAPLASCRALRLFTFVGHGAPYVDVTPLAAIATLMSVTIDGKNAPVLSANARTSIASPGMRALERAGALDVQ